MSDPAFTWDRRPGPSEQKRKTRHEVPAEPAPPLGGRITLKEAEHRFGVSVGTLRSWARDGAVDAVKADGPNGRQWMITAESVAHRISHRAGSPPPAPREGATGPTADGTAMLVPRDAWDRLMDQLGNIHEAGLMLSEARERAARAETEAEFLRERLGEIRTERDELRAATRTREIPQPTVTPAPRTAPAAPTRRPTAWDMAKRWWRGGQG
ncbi:MAG: helix-turn-helix domain-containing protein [Acidimicrobiia bacterium]